MSAEVPSGPGTDPAACAAEALRLLQTHAYFADRVDWDSVTAQVSRAANQGASVVWALRPVWRALGDRHSFLRPARAQPEATLDAEGNVPDGWRPPPDLGYLRLPAISAGPRTPAALRYVEAAWARLREQPRPAGWVLDLRGNSGGSVVPMLAAVGPLLGEGEWLSYQRRDGSRLSYRYSAGEVLAGGHRVLHAPSPPTNDPQTAVAVLVDQRTASAAEGVVVAFRGRDRTRILGVPTAGVPTGNASYELADGSVLFITTSLAVDHRGRCYAAALEPDMEGGLPEAHSWLNAQYRRGSNPGDTPQPST